MTNVSSNQALRDLRPSYGVSSGSSPVKTALTHGLANTFGTVLNVGLGKGVGDIGGIGGTDIDDQRELFELQLKAQKDLQRFTMVTNLAKTEHDSRMAAVRNMRP